MSLLDLNALSFVVEKLNEEMAYQVSEGGKVPPNEIARLLTIQSTGENHSVHFIGICLWNSADEKKYEQLTAEEEIELNTSEKLEEFLRKCIMEELHLLSQINLIK